MNEYLHGAYGKVNAVGIRVPALANSAIVYIGTAPIQQLPKEQWNINKPVVVENMADARAKFGYSDDFASYTLCEAMKVHFDMKGVGPLIFINVFDPDAHKGTGFSQPFVPQNGRLLLNIDNTIYDSIELTPDQGDKLTPDVDYTLTYDYNRMMLVAVELKKGAFGKGNVIVKSNSTMPEKVTGDDIIGTTNDMGLNTGAYVLRDVYSATGFIPSYVAAPGWLSDPDVHDALASMTKKIAGHWDAYMFVDLPLTDGETALTMKTIAAWKESNGYNRDNETVYWPLVLGTDGKKYHLSVLAAANFQAMLKENDGVPYNSASNTDAGIIQNLYIGENEKNRLYNDEIINAYLNKNGIASATYMGGHWVIWGAHSAEYDQEKGDSINVAETNLMMLYYVSNDFQHRRSVDVDKPMTPNDIKSIVAEEQIRLDALVKVGALTYGVVHQNASRDARSDVINGDFSFLFDVTTTPLAKSLTAIVNWTDDGFKTYFQDY